MSTEKQAPTLEELSGRVERLEQYMSEHALTLDDIYSALRSVCKRLSALESKGQSQ
jgi:hypothetical protein